MVRFARRETGRVFARFEGGRLVALDRAGLAEALGEPETAGALGTVGLGPETGDLPEIDETLVPSETSTLGAWGEPTVREPS